MKKQCPKIILLIFVSFVSFVSFSQTKKDTKYIPYSHYLYEAPPIFQGGELEMYKFIKSHLVYPPSAINDRVGGKVLIQFTVDTTGVLKNIYVMKGVRADCDSSALNLIRLMPPWIPGKVNGKPACVRYILPIVFKLPDHILTYLSDPTSWPSFPGGESALQAFLEQNIEYETLPNTVGGKVYVSAMITETGKLDKISIKEGLCTTYDSIAINAIRKMPDWIPGTYDNKPAAMEITLPIVFQSPPDNKIYHHCEIMPTYTGGIDSLYQFISRNLKYPVCCCEYPEGRVVVRFVVTKEGLVENPMILRGLHPDLDNEALRIVNMLKGWMPAKQGGQEVGCYYNLPILFRRVE